MPDAEGMAWIIGDDGELQPEQIEPAVIEPQEWLPELLPVVQGFILQPAAPQMERPPLFAGWHNFAIADNVVWIDDLPELLPVVQAFDADFQPARALRMRGGSATAALFCPLIPLPRGFTCKRCGMRVWCICELHETVACAKVRCLLR